MPILEPDQRLLCRWPICAHCGGRLLAGEFRGTVDAIPSPLTIDGCQVLVHRHCYAEAAAELRRFVQCGSDTEHRERT